MIDREAFARSLAEPELFLVVFERHYEAIARYLARRLPSDTAADLASEVAGSSSGEEASAVSACAPSERAVQGLAHE